MLASPATPRPSRSGGARPSSARPRTQASRPLGFDSEPPPKKRRYIPGGPGGGGRFVDQDDESAILAFAGPGTVSAVSRQPRLSLNAQRRMSSATPNPPARRERSARVRTAAAVAAAGGRSETDEREFSSAAAVAAAVVQSEGYKPREERGWEEFHPNLNIDSRFLIFHAEDVDGTRRKEDEVFVPPAFVASPSKASSVADGGSPRKAEESMPPGSIDGGDAAVSVNGDGSPHKGTVTPLRRRLSRAVRETASLNTGRFDPNQTPRTPRVLPIQNQTAKERLDLKLPSYRKTDRILHFESKSFAQAKYVDKSMANVGYQETDNFVRPNLKLIKAGELSADDEAEPVAGEATSEAPTAHSTTHLGRVEYDMDEQDDMWLESQNALRKSATLDPVTREVFEITMTKIEKEWYALERRIPKPNPKPPQTHRPRSSSAAAVNGETQAGEEQDSKCAICDDGDCENTNAIVFCDGCDLAVHQECYGVPFIPEGQWMCRKCQLVGRGIPTCVFCPNTDGAFKQTTLSSWAHLLCAMWIPEVSLGNSTFMEPIMDVDKVPKSRWRLTCYLCNQRMGACIQCGNKACYEAFHVTCARRAHLYLKMKNSQGALAVLDNSMVLKAFCHRHCPPEYAHEHGVLEAAKAAKKFYRKTMKGHIWANSQAMAQQLAVAHQVALPDSQQAALELNGARPDTANDKKKGQEGIVWKLPSGAPVIPQAVFDLVDHGLQRFTIRKRREFVIEACRYWTLKREARRGAALLKRLQLQNESSSALELTRRNFVAMGPSGKARLTRRVDFAASLLKDLEQLQVLAQDVASQQEMKLEQAEMQQDFVDTCYFPIHKLLQPAVARAQSLDKDTFKQGFERLQRQVHDRLYTTTLSFTADFCDVINRGINTASKAGDAAAAIGGPAIAAFSQAQFAPLNVSPSKSATASSEIKERRRLAKRIIKAVQPQLETALQAEAEVASKPYDQLLHDLNALLDASLEETAPVDLGNAAMDDSADVTMADAPADAERLEQDDLSEVIKAPAVSISTPALDANDATLEPGTSLPNGIKPSPTPPAINGYEPPAPALLTSPLTPPQSNGSLGAVASNPLIEGGIAWYLKPFELDGTTAVEQQWPGREAMRGMSEDLTDMDEEELNDLEVSVEDSTVIETLGKKPKPPAARKTKIAAGARVPKKLRSSARRR